MKIVLSVAFSILKSVLFVSLILLLGQIPVSHGTVGSHFVSLLKRGLEGGGDAILHSKPYEAVTNVPILSSIIPKRPAEVAPSVSHVKPPPPRPNHLADQSKQVEEPDEPITASDRESLLKLLK